MTHYDICMTLCETMKAEIPVLKWNINVKMSDLTCNDSISYMYYTIQMFKTLIFLSCCLQLTAYFYVNDMLDWYISKVALVDEQIIKKIFSHKCFQRSGVTCWLGSGSVTPAIPEHQWVVTSTFKWRLHRVWIHHSTESQQTSKVLLCPIENTICYKVKKRKETGWVRAFWLKESCLKKNPSDA